MLATGIDRQRDCAFGIFAQLGSVRRDVFSRGIVKLDLDRRQAEDLDAIVIGGARRD